VRQDAAFEEGVELVLDVAGQLGTRAGLGMGDETGRVLLHHAAQRGLLGAVALVVERVRVGGPRRARPRAPRLPGVRVSITWPRSSHEQRSDHETHC